MNKTLKSRDLRWKLQMQTAIEHKSRSSRGNIFLCIFRTRSCCHQLSQFPDSWTRSTITSEILARHLEFRVKWQSCWFAISFDISFSCYIRMWNATLRTNHTTEFQIWIACNYKPSNNQAKYHFEFSFSIRSI